MASNLLRHQIQKAPEQRLGKVSGKWLWNIDFSVLEVFLIHRYGCHINNFVCVLYTYMFTRMCVGVPEFDAEYSLLTLYMFSLTEPETRRFRKLAD